MNSPEDELFLCPQTEYRTILPALVTSQPHQNMTNACLCPCDALPLKLPEVLAFSPKVCAVLLALFTEAGAMLSSALELTKQPLKTHPLLYVTTRHLQKGSSNI